MDLAEQVDKDRGKGYLLSIYDRRLTWGTNHQSFALCQRTAPPAQPKAHAGFLGGRSTKAG